MQYSGSNKETVGTFTDHLSDALDAALDMTFPASDPIAIYRVEDSIPPRLPSASTSKR